ncbi:hypothetical protein [Aeromonas hydrophila]|uniref:hypothetical protein n=1 Tax=Aeromonas hydrophila TaxID=644 RepID=UPI001F61A30D|nr:hypothetical protein [Aeromonas hydrophila]UNU30558.1 hypothetical protein GCK65_16235 [Aeromonas hydrophila]
MIRNTKSQIKEVINRALTSAHEIHDSVSSINSKNLSEIDVEKFNSIILNLEYLINFIATAYENNNAEHYLNIKNTFDSIDSIGIDRLISLVRNPSELYNKFSELKVNVYELVEFHIKRSEFSNKEQDSFINGKIKQLEKKQNTVLSDIERVAMNHKREMQHNEQEFNVSINNKFSEMHGALTNTQVDALEKITAKEKDIINAASKIQQDINNTLLDVDKKILDAVIASSNTAQTEFNKIKNESLTEMQSGIMNQIRIFSNAHKKLNQLLEVAGNDILAKDNLKQAEQERKEADFLRNTGFVFLVAAVIYIAIEIGLLVHGNTEVTIEKILIRLIVTLVLMIPSAYLLKESARHRADERNFRKKGIHLATIDSYLANFDDASKLDVKRQLTANFFDNNDSVIDYSTVPDMNTSLVKILEAFVDKMKKENPGIPSTTPTPEASSKK